jgi:hypothetical protein
MNETRLRELLREVPVPGAEEAERRGRAVVAAAFAQRPRERRAVLPRFAIAVAAAALLAILVLSPAGAAVRGWIDDVFTAGAPNAEKALTRIPGGGRLLVQSQAGPWVVQPGGSRRLLGDYGEATWSPHGLYLAVARGRTLTAVEPDGTPHWSLSAPAAVSDPRWSPSGYRIAYRAGTALRVVHADGAADALLAPRVAPIAPSWSPDGLPELAYVDARGRLVVSEANSGRRLAVAKALPGIVQLEWGPGGVLVEASRSAVAVRPIVLDKLSSAVRIGAPRRVGLPGRSRLTGVAVSPSGRTLAVLRRLNLATRSRAEVDLVHLRPRRTRHLFDTPGRLGEIAWSPDGSRLLITWPEADQWLFVPVHARGRLKAVAGISRTFAPGSRSGGAFPSVAGWCCR